MKAHYKKPAHGFALIEALVAMMVVSFGMLAVAGFQTTLSLNADVAKQRTEATRLAQQKMEDLRTFENLTKYGTQMVSSSAVTPVTQETITSIAGTTTNATFIRSWGITSAGTPDTGRSVVVTVAWTDRAGNAQQVQLTSHVSATDPLLAGSLWFPLPDGTILRRPKNRNLDIPIPSVDLGNGKSAVRFKDNGKYILFDNITGDVTNTCTDNTLTSTSTADEIKNTLKDPSTSNTGICTKIIGYIVAGYVDVSLEDGAKTSPITIPTGWNANSIDIDHSGITYTPATNYSTECQFGDAKDQNSGITIANYKSYICLISWPAPTTNGPNNQTYEWNGTIKLSGTSIWEITEKNKKTTHYDYVCRFQYANSTIDSNERNERPYTKVNKSLDQQNYFLASTTGTPSCAGTKMNVTNISTGVLHQNCNVDGCPTRTK
ncbi:MULTISPECIES: type IV pilus modification PilV family protein [unclassified Acidovorax]|uniref:type IV pilus modification PilV family protein n=1 Tax=unclassified Acidovorax TaxID=2684926 RepID=UPI0011773FFC|nr:MULTISPECIES: prepilin-type N-terminal cleavage/methylation domain-containing protein [unclassified Acidovorax]